MTTTTTTIAKNKKTLTGVVISDKMTGTITVQVDRFVKHPKYGKYIAISKKYKAHVDGVKPAVGSKVTIRESRPYAKTVSFEVVA